MRISSIVYALATPLLIVGSSSCGPTYPSCEMDEHCAIKQEYCVNRNCVVCREDKHCKVALGPCGRCQTNPPGCQVADGCCASDADCPDAKCWKTGEAGQCGPGCRRDADCSDMKACIEGQCRHRCGCGEASECPAKAVCSECNCAGQACVIQHPLFAPGKATMSGATKKTMRSSMACIQGLIAAISAEEGKIVIEGHAVHSRSNEEKDTTLSAKRAELVRDFLVQGGIPEDRVTTTALGRTQPRCEDRSKACLLRNNRVEILFR